MSKRRRSSGSRRVAEAKFWGQSADDRDRPQADGGVGPAESASSDGDVEADGLTADGSRGSGDSKAEGSTPNGSRGGDAGKAKGNRDVTVVVRPTPDPGALVRSLGAPPLAVEAGLAERHLTAVYEEAVRAATALAAASGLLAGDADEP